jgi:hypothetical protein
MWIKFDSIDTSATTFYMYYGNISATATSSGVGTFPLFDDFDDGSIDTSKWTNMGGSVEAGGELTATATSLAAYGVASKTFFGVNYAIRCRIKPTHVGGTTYLESCSLYDASNDQQVTVYFCQVSSTFSQKCTNLVVSYTNANLTGVAAGVYCIVDICRNSTTDVKYLVDNNPIATIATNVPTGSNHDARIEAYANGSVTIADWVFVRKYQETEPSWGVWGEQEWVDGTPWLTGWNYRKRFSLSAASAATNYQIKLLLGESSASSGAQVHCHGLCDNAFDDIRITTFDGVAVLPYFIESISGATPAQIATIWIKADYIGTTPTSFYLYYGNSSAVAVSNAGDTLEFFDDFLVNPPSATDWYHWLNNGTTTVSGSVLTITGHASYNAWGCKRQFGTNYAYRSKVKVSAESGGDIVILGVDDRSATGSYIGSGADSAIVRLGTNVKYYQLRREGVATDNSRSDVLTSWSVVEIRRNASVNAEFLINDVSKGTYSANLPLDNAGITYYTNDASVLVYSDWAMVRKYQSPEPAYLGFQTQEPYAMGWPAGWSKRLKLTLAGSHVTENTIDFPVMIYLDSTCSGVFSELGDNSKKISLRLEDYTECYVEVECWDSSSKKAVLWAKIPTLIAGNNINMYLFFDNSHEDNTKYVGLTTETAAKGVWESSYKCVLHFAQTPAGTGSVKDSTIYANNSNPGAGVVLTDGEFGKAYDFTPDTTGYVDVPDHTSLDATSALTMNIFLCIDNFTLGAAHFLGKNTTGSTYAWGLYAGVAGTAYPVAWGDEAGTWGPLWSASESVVLTTGIWIMLTGVFNGSTMKLYRNGTLVGTSGSSAANLYNSSGNVHIGHNSEFSQKLDGKVAHASVAFAVRSDAYLLLTYKTMKNQLITKGAIETAPAPSVPYKLLKMSILETNVDSDLTNFPVLVHLSSSCGSNSFNASDVFTTLGSDDNRKKFIITTVSGNVEPENQCSVEIERWTTVSGEAWLWVKVPAVASGTNTALYMYYGSTLDDNPNVGDTNSVAARGVWDNGYVLVYHSNQDPFGGSECVKDSTYRLNHGTPQGTMLSEDLVTAKIGRGYDIDGANDGISIPLTASLKGLEVATMECWVKPHGAPVTGYGAIIWEGTNTIGYTRFGSFHLADKKVMVVYRDTDTGSSFTATSPSAITDNVWTYVVYSVDAATNVLSLYLNDTSVATNVTSKGAMTNTTPTFIGFGRDDVATPECFDGVVDEARISNVCRSASWLKASYYSGMDNLVYFGPIEDHTPSSATHYFSGTVSAQGSPVERMVLAYRRDTGELVGTATSVSGTGTFYLETTHSGDHYVVCLDDTAGDVYNALVYDYIIPVTIS